MKLKEKLAIAYSRIANDDFAHIPKQVIRQNAYLAGFEKCRALVLSMFKDITLDSVELKTLNIKIFKLGEEETE